MGAWWDLRENRGVFPLNNRDCEGQDNKQLRTTQSRYAVMRHGDNLTALRITPQSTPGSVMSAMGPDYRSGMIHSRRHAATQTVLKKRTVFCDTAKQHRVSRAREEISYINGTAPGQ